MEDAVEYDKRNLIGDALSLEGLAIEEYRAIFFDWAFGLPEGAEAGAAARAMLARHADADPAHPIIGLLRDAQDGAARRAGRGARSARRRRG